MNLLPNIEKLIANYLNFQGTKDNNNDSNDQKIQTNQTFGNMHMNLSQKNSSENFLNKVIFGMLLIITIISAMFLFIPIKILFNLNLICYKYIILIPAAIIISIIVTYLIVYFCVLKKTKF